MAHQCPKDQDGGDELGYRTGNGNTGHIPFKDNHEKEIEKDIENPGKGKEEQRTLCVADRIVNSTAEVINRHCRDPEKIQADIQDGTCEQFGFCSEQDQNWPDQKLSGDADDNSGQNGKRQSRMDSTFRTALLP